MENKSIMEDFNEIQIYVVNMRKKYSDKITKYYEQNSKIDLKLLEKQHIKSETRFEAFQEFSIEDNAVDYLNKDLVDKEKMNILREKLKNLNTITMEHIRTRNCDLYKQITEKIMKNVI